MSNQEKAIAKDLIRIVYIFNFKDINYIRYALKKLTNKKNKRKKIENLINNNITKRDIENENSEILIKLRVYKENLF